MHAPALRLEQPDGFVVVLLGALGELVPPAPCVGVHGLPALACADRGLDTNEWAQNLSKNHPLPSFLETSRISEVTSKRGDTYWYTNQYFAV